MLKSDIKIALDNLRTHQSITAIESYKSIDNIDSKLITSARQAISTGNQHLSEYFELCHRIITGTVIIP